MVDQLEFDFVSPWLGNPTRDELRILNEATELLSKGEQMLVLRKLASELQRQALQLDPNPSSELDELKVLLGSAAWKKSETQWRRRVRQNPSRVRKVILCMRALYELSAIQQTKKP